MNTFTKKLAVCLLAVFVCATALTACGKKATTMTHTTTPTTTYSAPATSTYSAPATPSAAATASTKTCPAGYTSGMIGGTTKCLTAGQQCQTAHAADYTQYGFTCGTTGVLTARTSTGSASSTAKATYCPSTGASPGRWPAGTYTSGGVAMGGKTCSPGAKLA